MQLRKLVIGENQAYSVGSKAGIGYMVHEIIHVYETWVKSSFKIRHYIISRKREVEDADAEKWKEVFISTGGTVIEEFDPKVIYNEQKPFKASAEDVIGVHYREHGY